MRLPSDLENIIFEFHDEFNVIEKKKLINFIIRRSYLNWLTDAGVYSRFYCLDEFSCKQELYPYVGPKVFVTNRTGWLVFLQYFACFERFVSQNKGQCFPGCHS